MSKPRRTAEEILSETLEHAQANRIAFLEWACGDDLELRASVERLLAAQSRADGRSDALGPTEEAASSGPQEKGVERVGAHLGPYKLLQVIGAGGMGIVYMAEQQRPVARRVALKIIKPGMDSDQVIARFEAERQALSLMDHPNIARVLDAGATAGGRPFFAMELVKGQPITQYCDERHLTPRERLELFLPVCQAIQHAHQKGVIHRDIKPSNVLVAEFDRQAIPKVIDFGVAKAIGQPLTEKTMFTQLGQIVGTLEYMSPEQAKVNQLDIDTRSDVYSLGVMLYELLTGATPFDKARLRSAALDELLRIIREEEPPRPSARLSTVATLAGVAANRRTEPSRLSSLLRGELDWIIMKALHKDRNLRYESANSLAADLQRHLSGEAVLARPPSLGYLLKKRLWRHKWKSAAAALLAICVLALIASAVSFSYSGRLERSFAAEAAARSMSDRQRDEARRQRDEANKQRRRAEEASKAADISKQNAIEQQTLAEAAQQETAAALALANRYAYYHNVIAADAAWRDGDIARADQLLQDCPPEDRGWEWRLLTKRNHPELLTMEGHQGRVLALDISSDGAFAASGGIDGTVRLWRLSDGSQERLFQISNGGAAITSVAISPATGDVATISNDGAVWFCERATGRHRRVSTTQVDGDGLLDFDSTGKLLALTGDSQIAIWNVTEERFQWRVEGRATVITEVVFSPDGKQLATVGWDGFIRLLNVDDGAVIDDLSAATGALQTVAYSPDGRRLAIGGLSGRIVIVDRVTREPVQILTGNEAATRCVRFAPDGRHLATSASDGAIQLWDWRGGQSIQLLRGHQGHVYRICFHPTTGDLVSCAADGEVKYWSIADEASGLLCAPWSGSAVTPTRIAFGPDSKVLARNGVDGAVQVIDPESGDLLAEKALMQPGTRMDAPAVAIRPVGDRLAAGDDRGIVHFFDSALHDHRSQSGHASMVTALAYSPDGRWLVSACEQGDLAIWDGLHERIVRRGRSFVIARTSGIRDAFFHPEGIRFFVVCSDGVEEWDTARGELQASYPALPNRALAAAAINNDGSRLATGEAEGDLALWDVETRKLLWSKAGHAGGTLALAFSPDGTRLATTGADRRVKIWDAAIGYELITLKGLINQAHALKFDASGEYLAVGDAGHHLRVWSSKTPSTPAERNQLAKLRRLIWQKGVSLQAARDGDWDAVTWHVDSLLANSDPQDVNLNIGASVGLRVMDLLAASQPAKALEECRKALPFVERLAEQFTQNADYRKEHALALLALGLATKANDEVQASVDSLTQAIRLLDDLPLEDFPNAAEFNLSARQSLAEALAELDRHTEAAAVWQAILDRRLAQDEAWAWFQEGAALIAAGQTVEAEISLDRGFALREEAASAEKDSQPLDWLRALYCFDRGVLYQGPKDLKRMLPWMDRAVNELSEHVARWSNAEAAALLCQAHQKRGWIFDQLARDDDAEGDWNVAVELGPPERGVAIRIVRAISLAQANKTDRALREADELSQASSLAAIDKYNLACVYSVASSTAGERQEPAAAQAVKWLGEAVAAGYNDYRNLRRAPDLAPLRARDDFNFFLKSLPATANGK